MCFSLCPALQQVYSYIEPVFIVSETFGKIFLSFIQKIQAFAHPFFLSFNQLAGRLNPFSALSQTINTKSFAMLTCLCLVGIILVSIWKRSNQNPSSEMQKRRMKDKKVYKVKIQEISLRSRVKKG